MSQELQLQNHTNMWNPKLAGIWQQRVVFTGWLTHVYLEGGVDSVDHGFLKFGLININMNLY